MQNEYFVERVTPEKVLQGKSAKILWYEVCGLYMFGFFYVNAAVSLHVCFGQ